MLCVNQIVMLIICEPVSWECRNGHKLVCDLARKILFNFTRFRRGKTVNPVLYGKNEG